MPFRLNPITERYFSLKNPEVVGDRTSGLLLGILHCVVRFIKLVIFTVAITDIVAKFQTDTINQDASMRTVTRVKSASLSGKANTLGIAIVSRWKHLGHATLKRIFPV